MNNNNIVINFDKALFMNIVPAFIFTIINNKGFIGKKDTTILI